MAPSQQDFNTLEYTHKKFNYDHSDKKLGMRLIHRKSEEDLQEQQQQEQQQQEKIVFTKEKQSTPRTSSVPRKLFRPYALDKDSPRKRKISNNQHSSRAPNPIPAPAPFQNYTTPVVPQLLYHLYQTSQQYALKLQRQRAALYMKHVMQFYENGNGWPSVHPNAINNPAIYKQN